MKTVQSKQGDRVKDYGNNFLGLTGFVICRPSLGVKEIVSKEL